MASVAQLLSEAWLVLLLSLIVSVVVFPLVFVSSLFYSWLAEKYGRTPRILLMAVTTFLAVLAAVLLLELYLGYTLAEVIAAAQPQQ